MKNVVRAVQVKVTLLQLIHCCADLQVKDDDFSKVFSEPDTNEDTAVQVTLRR